MPIEKFDLSFSNLSPDEYIETVGTFADLLVGHPFFKESWPDYLPHPLYLKGQLKAYGKSATLAKAEGGKTNLRERDELREEAQCSVVLMAQYVVMRSRSEKDPSLLTTVGLKLKKRIKRNRGCKQRATMVAPVGVTVTHAKDSEAVLVSCGKVFAAGTYEVFICDGDPTDPRAWREAGHYNTCLRIRIAGQEPGKKVYFKIRCHGTGAPRPFSDYVGIIIL